MPARRHLIVLLASTGTAQPGCNRWMAIGMGLQLDAFVQAHGLPRGQASRDSLELQSLFRAEHGATS